MEQSIPKPSSAGISGSAPALERGLHILECLSRHHEGATLSEVSGELDLPKNSTLRLLQTLTHSGYLARDERSLRYRLTDKLLRIGQPRVRDISLVECALDAMKSLRDAVGETAQLGIATGDEGVIIEKFESNNAIRIGVEIGLRFPLHNNAPGKILLAYREPSDRELTLARITLDRCTDRTITDVGALRKECERVVTQGYASDWGEADEGIHCVAAPVRERSGRLVATVWVSGIAGRMPKSLFPSVAVHVVRGATEIERRLR